MLQVIAEGFVGLHVLVMDVLVFGDGQQLVVVGEGVSGLLCKQIEHSHKLVALVLDIDVFVELGRLRTQ